MIAAAEFKVGEEVDDVRKCHGDSGGPSFWEADDGIRLVGVTSHAYDNTDCFETGGVDTRIDFYFDWIEENMVAKCNDGTRVWCEEKGILAPNYFDEEDDDDDEDEKGFFLCGCFLDLILYSFNWNKQFPTTKNIFDWKSYSPNQRQYSLSFSFTVQR